MAKVNLTINEDFNKETQIAMKYTHPVNKYLNPHYPFNPNGWTKIMALLDETGRHLAIILSRTCIYDMAMDWLPYDKLPHNDNLIHG